MKGRPSITRVSLKRKKRAGSRISLSPTLILSLLVGTSLFIVIGSSFLFATKLPPTGILDTYLPSNTLGRTEDTDHVYQPAQREALRARESEEEQASTNRPRMEQPSLGDNRISATDGIHQFVRHVRREVPTNDTHMFYNVYLNKESAEARRRSDFTVREQVQQIANSTVANNTVRYNLISGRYLPDICYKSPQLDCRRMHYYKQGFEELTLAELYNYCQNHSDEKVIYLHNKGSYRKERGNTKLRRLATTAVTSHACLEMPLSSHYPCNVCGLTFQTLPYFHMTSNMWVAECSYIQKLIPPKLYTRKRRDLLMKLQKTHPECLNSRHEWNWTSNTFLKQFGLGRYAMERWLASHPDMIPCDVIPFRLARFKRGFEEWFNPTLYPSRHYQWDQANVTEIVWIMVQEYKYLYGVDEPNFAFLNHTYMLREREKGGRCGF